MASGRDERDLGRDATDALKTLLVRVGEIFGILDLSFIVAGVVCFGAVVFAVWIAGGAPSLREVQHTELQTAHVGAAILTSYVLGIVCFAAGRKLRREHTFYAALATHLRDFGLEARYARFLPKGTDADATHRYKLLYTRLWAEVRQNAELAPSFNLVMRYWVMAAMCDGLAAAFVVWLFLWVAWGVLTLPVAPPSAPALGIGALAFGAGAALTSLEAHRYARAQMYELCATLAYRYANAEPAALAAVPFPAAPAPELADGSPRAPVT